MQNQEKIEKVKDLCFDIIHRNELYVDQDHGTYYDYDKVIGLLEQVVNEMDLARTPRPSDLPDDIAWSETFWNGETEPDPFVFDGSMSVEEFEKFQDNYFGAQERKQEIVSNSEFYHTLAVHQDVLTVPAKIDEFYKEYQDLGYNIIEKLPNSFLYRLEDSTEVLLAWDGDKGVIFEDVVKFPEGNGKG